MDGSRYTAIVLLMCSSATLSRSSPLPAAQHQQQLQRREGPHEVTQPTTRPVVLHAHHTTKNTPVKYDSITLPSLRALVTPSAPDTGPPRANKLQVKKAPHQGKVSTDYDPAETATAPESAAPAGAAAYEEAEYADPAVSNDTLPESANYYDGAPNDDLTVIRQRRIQQRRRFRQRRLRTGVLQQAVAVPRVVLQRPRLLDGVRLQPVLNQVVLQPVQQQQQRRVIVNQVPAIGLSGDLNPVRRIGLTIPRSIQTLNLQVLQRVVV